MYKIYATPGCGFCIQAKRLLESKELEYEYTLVSDLEEQERNNLQETAGLVFRTVPQIFEVDESGDLTYIGGFTQLKAKLEGE